MTAFPVPGVLSIAPRRTYYLEKFQDISYGLRWKSMLTELAPRQAKPLNPLEPLKCWAALLAHCATLFPVFEPWIEEWDGADYSAPGEAWYFGVPVNVQGVEGEILYDTVSPAMALALFYGEYDQVSEDSRIEMLKNIDALKNIKCLEPIIRRPLSEAWYRQYHDRQWKTPWDGAGLFLDYCFNNTGYQILDWSHQAVLEGGGYPEWNIEEIRGNADEWKAAEPVLKRIHKFRDWVDARPEGRLPVLAGILTGDADVLANYSTPRRKRTKTLVEVFGEA